MTCLGDSNDATFYSASYPSGELELYQFVDPLPDGWYVIEWPGHAVRSQSDLQAAVIHGKYFGNLLFEWLTRESPEPVGSTTSHATHIDDYNHSSYTRGYWPAARTEPHRSGFLGCDVFFTATAGSDISTEAPTPHDGEYLRCLGIHRIEHSPVANSPIQPSGRK